METDGSGLDLSCSDEISGNLVCGCGIVKMEKGHVWLNVNARCPVTVNGSELMERLEKHAKKNAFYLEKRRVLESNYYPKEKEEHSLIGNHRFSTQAHMHVNCPMR